MSDLYRLTVTPSNPADTDAELTAHEMLQNGWLVLAERCEHGFLDPHIVTLLPDTRYEGGPDRITCPGAAGKGDT